MKNILLSTVMVAGSFLFGVEPISAKPKILWEVRPQYCTIQYSGIPVDCYRYIVTGDKENGSVAHHLMTSTSDGVMLYSPKLTIHNISGFTFKLSSLVLTSNGIKTLVPGAGICQMTEGGLSCHFNHLNTYGRVKTFIIKVDY